MKERKIEMAAQHEKFQAYPKGPFLYGFTHRVHARQRWVLSRIIRQHPFHFRKIVLSELDDSFGREEVC